ncbi:hypothetical protein [Mesoterricola silvestris]|uniref:Uncharacterized protein n=1 Tax=Mesoterricola silvestris TaxID=2927979 RepID=A0AA48KBC6_9BACT|nr:hypothetical protein [Mesoterricola silvestris]BDU74197.1 hypothetical protein METEAL_33710 [Mesoterricola silvestris]
MLPTFNRRRAALAALAAATVLGAGAYLKIRRDLNRALAAPGRLEAPLQLLPVRAEGPLAERWGGGEVEGVAATETTLATAGAAGLRDEGGEIASALPTLRVACVALWRGRLVAGLEAGGLYLRDGAGWQELVAGFGPLHVRALAETPGGELLIGAREGLFRAAWGARTLRKLDGHSVRAVALGPGGLMLAGGEEGLRRVEPARATLLPTPDPWIEWVGCPGQDVAVVTPLGLARGPLGGALAAVPGGEDATSAAVAGEEVLAAGGGRLLRFGPGRTREDFLPALPRKVLAASGLVFADTDAGLYRRTREGWVLARPRPAALPPGSAHVGALAWLGPRLVAGIFNGGLAVGEARGAEFAWTAVPGSRSWGVNALLPVGGALQVASLRGSARYDGRTLSEAGPEGAAFSLAATRDGVAVGLGQGVLLPGSRLLSAFHGLPGNQALALASGDALFVGTPTGLGAVVGNRVAWRVTAGEGRLPHPWITALALHRGDLFIGTYGGGVARRTAPADQPRALGTFQAFPETAALKVNTGCLAEAAGRLYLGTDGGGLWRLAPDGARFERLRIHLPSPRVTAILEGAGALFVGTDEGLARIPLPIPDEGT